MGDMAGLYEEDDIYAERPDHRICRYCGTSGLQWRELNSGWRLFSADGLHVCPIERKDKGEKPVTKFKTFWILWQPVSAYPPKIRFDNKKAAEEAAEVMTSRYKCEFYVMRADGLCQISAPPIKWSKAKEK